MDYNKMIRENEKIMNTFNYYTRQYYNSSYIKFHMELEDYRQEQEIALYKRFISYYDESRYKLSTFVIMSIKSTNKSLYKICMKEKNRLNSSIFKYSLDYEENDEDGSTCNLNEAIPSEDDNTISFLIDSLDVDLTEKEKKVLYLTYLKYSTREIDRILNLKEQSTKYIIRKIRKKLKNINQDMKCS